MSEKDTIFKSKVRQRGLFDFKDTYEFAYNWLMDENYDLFERKYTEKVKGESKDVEVKWEAMKEISDYFRYVIEVQWVILGMKSVEVQQEGKKIKKKDDELKAIEQEKSEGILTDEDVLAQRFP